MKHEITTALTCLILSLPAFAQDASEQAPRTVALRPALVLRTGDPMISSAFHARFATPNDVLPEPGEDQHYSFVVTTDGKIETKTVTGKIGWVVATIHPPALMDLFGKQIDRNWEMIRDSATLGLTQMGISAKQGAIMMQAVKDFPQQIQAVDITVSQDPRTSLAGLQVGIAIRPSADSWLSRLVGHLRPHDQGAPTVEAKDPMVAVTMAVDPQGLESVLAPFIEVLSHVGTKNQQERARNRSLYTKMLSFQDGTFCSAGNPFGGTYRVAAGLRDPKGLATMIASGDYARMSEGARKMSPMVEAEVEANAFTHRDVPVMKTTVTAEIDLPTMPSGEQISYSAVAGSYMVTVTAENPEVTKQLIDAALDQKLKRAPLPGGVLMVMEFKLMDLLDKLTPGGNPFAGREQQAPQLVRLTMDTKRGTLNFDVTLR